MIATMGLASAYCSAADDAGDDVLISNKYATITRQDFEAKMQSIPKKDRFEFRASLDRINKLLDGLYVKRALANKAREAGMEQDALLQQEIKLEADGVLFNAWLDKLQEQAVLPDFSGRAKELYLAEPEKYTDPVEVNVSHILISSQHRTDEEALKRAEEVHEKALKGDSFSSLAAEYSDDPSVATNKGELGLVPVTKFDSDFAKAALALQQPGDISQPVKSRFGYHIILLHEKKDGVLKPFDSVKEDIIKHLRKQYLDDIWRDAIDEAQRADRQVNSEAILKLKTELPFAQKPTDKPKE